MNTIPIHKAAQENLPDLRAIAGAMKAANSIDYFETVLEKQNRGTLDVYMMSDKAYVILNFEPKYGLYKKLEIPEIQDLNVVPSARQNGIGHDLVKHCEAIAIQKKYTQIGISVGLHRGFGAAQRLYTKMGYIPDGNGITYDRAYVGVGDIRTIDDDLCLMMVKDLG